MSLFRKAGEKFEETKRSYLGDEEMPEYICRSCEKRVDDNYEYCPHCGEATVEPLA